MADIVKAFLQMSIGEQDRDALRFQFHWLHDLPKPHERKGNLHAHDQRVFPVYLYASQEYLKGCGNESV